MTDQVPMGIGIARWVWHNQWFVITFNIRRFGYIILDGVPRPLPTVPVHTRELQVNRCRTTTYPRLCGDTVVSTMLDTALHWRRSLRVRKII